MSGGNLRDRSYNLLRKYLKKRNHPVRVLPEIREGPPSYSKRTVRKHLNVQEGVQGEV